MFTEFIDAIRKLDIPEDFVGGNDKQRTKLNRILQLLRDFQQAANDDDTPALEEFEAYVTAGGEETLKRFIVAE